MVLSSKEDVKAIDDREYDTVEVPQWSKNGEAVEVRVQSLSGRERSEFRDEVMEAEVSETGEMVQTVNQKNAEELLVTLGVVDETGSKIFEKSDISWLRNKNSQAIDRIASAIRDLSGLGDEAVESAKKNSGSTMSDGSSSDSQPSSESL